MDQRLPELFEFGEFVRYCNKLLAEHPHLETHNVEMRQCLLAAPPERLAFDDDDKVVIFRGVYYRGF